ncbi:erythromycin esterase family protein [Haloprofundus salinisoli]|uniref:erythromycin esterase family protein n=1 Tax=Haloprofundus salinisoli TaxID=2876193 RepID=UPI001CCDBEE6|nr:erythromycin esterase family protein [Haloprofundus salinisoli]
MSSLWERGTETTEGVEAVADCLRSHARPLDGPADLGPLVERVADADYVLLGEASHGTSEFYRWRARLTARLLDEHDFSFVAVEGNWTDCYEVNEFIKHRDDVDGARDTLDRFDRWPTWMWANWELVELVEWMRERNGERPEDERVGFYGLDVYSLYESMEAVLEYLEDVNPDALEQARDAYNCFSPYGEDARSYARSTRMVPDSCEDEVVEALTDLRRKAREYEAENSDAYFSAEQNAFVAQNAERYYRTMVRSSSESWNVRDRHMAETLDRLREHHDGGKAVVWAHNTHVGDARATDMARRGELNLGQLVRESNADDDVAIVGFGTHRGSVVAADSWGDPHKRMRVPPAREGSYGDAFHRALGESGNQTADGFVVFDEMAGEEALAEPRGHRAIGVVYHPERDRGNYVPTVLPRRYDAFVHVDESTALHPLHGEPEGTVEPETYPWGV